MKLDLCFMYRCESSVVARIHRVETPEGVRAHKSYCFGRCQRKCHFEIFQQLFGVERRFGKVFTHFSLGMVTFIASSVFEPELGL